MKYEDIKRRFSEIGLVDEFCVFSDRPGLRMVRVTLNGWTLAAVQVGDSTRYRFHLHNDNHSLSRSSILAGDTLDGDTLDNVTAKLYAVAMDERKRSFLED